MNKEPWENIWSKMDTSYNQEKIISQWDMFERMKIKHLEAMFPRATSGKKIGSLECGCGGATVSVFFSGKGYKTFAFDYSPEALRVARANLLKEGRDADLFCADVKSIPTKDNAFDVVMSFGLIEHFKDVRPQIKEMVRVLKPGGLLFLDISPNGYHLKNKSIQCENIVRPFNFFISFIYHLLKFRFSIQRAYNQAKLVFLPEYDENELSLGEYEKLVRSAGIDKVTAYGNRPFPRIYLPGFLNTMYLALMRYCEPLWIRFDNSKSSFSRFWGAGWWLYGIKTVEKISY